MKKIIFLIMVSMMSLGLFSEEKKWEILPTLSASGTQQAITINGELVIAGKFTLSKNVFLFGQVGTMYNLFENKINDIKSNEWQLGFEPMIGFGTNHFRLSGFLNSLTIKNLENVKMPFVEGGVRFSIIPWKEVWISVFGTWPISDPILISSLYDEYFSENNEGVYLNKTTTEKWAKQLQSYGADIDAGIGKNFILGFDAFAINENNYQIGTGLQYRLFKNKSWVLGGNVFYTNFEKINYYYIHNLFPSMFEGDIKGYTFKLGISNRGGLGELNFSNLLGRISQPMYFSPVVWEEKQNLNSIKINEALKVNGCVWGGKCFDFDGSLCITGGKPSYKIFADWGDGSSTSYNTEVSGSFKIQHHYLKEGTYNILISIMDVFGKTVSYSGKFIAEDCTPKVDPCSLVYLTFGANKTAILKGDTVNFNWNADGADTVTLDGLDVAHKVPLYPVIFNTIGTFNKTLRAYKDGKICKEKIITITVTAIPCESCKDTNIVISGSNTNTTRTITLTNKGCQPNTFKIDAVGKEDSTTKATKSLTVTLAIGETRIITATYDKNVTITFNGTGTSTGGQLACVYYLYITAACIK